MKCAFAKPGHSSASYLVAPPECDAPRRALREPAAIAPAGEGSQRNCSGAAACAGKRRVVRRFVESQLESTDLTPALVARTFAISVRQLHQLFESSGTTFSRDLAARRIARVRTLLAARPDLPITEVALASGFGSLPTFYRCFADACHATPSAVRAAAKPPLHATRDAARDERRLEPTVTTLTARGRPQQLTVTRRAKPAA